MEINRVTRSDVAVLGAGTAGAVAAIAAADMGMSVTVVEQFGAPGGSGTLGLVTPMMRTCVPGNPMCSYVGREINKRMLALGAAAGDGDSWFDPLMLCVVLEQMLAERHVNMLYHTCAIGARAKGGRLTGVETHAKSGRGLVCANIFIDATGDADIVKFMGLPYFHGDDESGANQPMSLRYTVGGVDLDAFWRALCVYKNLSLPYPARPANFDGAVTTGGGKTWPLSPVFESAIARGALEPEDAAYWQFFTIPGRAGELAFNCPEFFDIRDADDEENLTRVQIEGKRAILRQLGFYRASLPGFENSYISSIAPMVGVRESRRAVTDHILTADELIARVRFDDAICISNYPVDIHGRKLKCEQLCAQAPNAKPYFEIPLRALIVKHADNLMVAGRCLGAEYVAQSAARIIPTCRAMGEACGIAAALCKGKDLRALNGARVREEMIRRGADFGAYS